MKRRWGSMAYTTCGGVLVMSLGAASCTAILGIDKGYHEGSGGAASAASAASSAAGGSGGAPGTTVSSTGSASASSSGAGGGSDGGVNDVSCAAILQANPQSMSGVYTLDPDGPGGSPPFQAFCEMTGDGGGWTLVLKIDGKKPTFEYSTKLWQDDVPANPGDPFLDNSEAKLQSFATIPFSSVRLGMVDAGVTRWIVVPLGKKATLSKLILNGTLSPTGVGRVEWQQLVASPSLQLNCNDEGFDVHPGSGAQVRIGIIANDQADCNTADSLLGFGADVGHGGPSGNYAMSGAEHGSRTTTTFGYVMGR